MKKPPKLFVSELTGNVYISSAYKIIDEEKGTILLTGKQYDVTTDFEYICRKLGYSKNKEEQPKYEIEDAVDDWSLNSQGSFR